MQTSQHPTISEAEWKVMRELWRKAPQPAYDLAAALADSERWKPATVKTLLSRLLKKGAVEVERYKNLYLYTPAVTEEECLRHESEGFLKRLFGGSAQPLLVHFAKTRKLSKADLEELGRILEEER